MLDFVKNYYTTINLIALIVGWIIINLQNNQRELRKEIRSALNDIQKMIIEIESMAIGYHTEKRKTTTELTLNARLSLLSQRIELAFKPLDIDCSDVINAYRESIVENGNFGKSEHKSLDDDDIKLMTIRNYANQLSLQLEEDFFKSYQKKNFYFRKMMRGLKKVSVYLGFTCSKNK